MTLEQFVEQTAGPTLKGIRHLFLRAMSSEERRLTTSYVRARKRELIERDSRGMLEVVSPRHGMDAVGGNDDMLKNFRGMYVGQTEGNLDTIFNILKAMTPNIAFGALGPLAGRTR